jgi:glycosyltransferase involved in cell wall biosynthesis
MSRALIVCHDVVGPSMAGPGIRYWEMAAALRRRGQDATLAAPAPADGVVAYRVGDGALVDLARQHDALVVTGPILEQFPELKGLGRPLVVDLYDPFLFENLARQAGWLEYEGGMRTLAEQARCGDFFVCASERQRDLYLGMLAAWGRVSPTTYEADPGLRSLIDVVPFGIDPEPPRPGPALRGALPGVAAGDRVVVWNGGLWDWFDPLTAIRAVDRLAVSQPRLRLVFLGTRHPNPAIGEPPMARRARALAAELDPAGRVVSFRDWTPYAERGAYLLDADLAISLHADGVETRFAFRTRLLDCVWAGLPTVTTDGDVIGQRLAARGLGATVPVGDADAVAAALAALLAEPDARAARRDRFASLAAELTWDRAVAPLAAFLAAPRRAADRQPAGAADPQMAGHADHRAAGDAGSAPARDVEAAPGAPAGPAPTARGLWRRLRSAAR